MDVATVVDVWDDIETEPESEGSYEYDEDRVVQEFEGDSSDNETDPVPSTSASIRSTRPRGRPVEYNWEEISDGKDIMYNMSIVCVSASNVAHSLFFLLCAHA